MAAESVTKTETTAQLTTAGQVFDEIPVLNNHLLEVRPGIDTDYAHSTAECLESSVHKLLERAVSDDGMDAETAYLCAFVLDASMAIRRATGPTI